VLLLGVIRDVLVQGAGNMIVRLIWSGRVIPDVWAPPGNGGEIVSEGPFFYQHNGERHMYAGPVFAVGLTFWFVAAMAVVAYIYT